MRWNGSAYRQSVVQHNGLFANYRSRRRRLIRRHYAGQTPKAGLADPKQANAEFGSTSVEQAGIEGFQTMEARLEGSSICEGLEAHAREGREPRGR
jgi:hypothetical protein